jgi:hypothetical protein
MGLLAVPLSWVCRGVGDPEKEFKSQALLLCSDLDAKPERIISWLVRRWQIELTSKEARRHLRFETQRQSDSQS